MGQMLLGQHLDLLELQLILQAVVTGVECS